MNRLHVQTPLYTQEGLPEIPKARVQLKMECFQPIGSFKLRGIGYACQRYMADGAQGFVASSGGNAGLAVAYAGRILGLPVTVIVPNATSQWMRQLIAAQGANVIQHGDAWDDSHAYAQSLLYGSLAYIHPFDDPYVWQGHASLVHELAEQSTEPDAMIVAVGGGGLLCGILQGLEDVGWSEVEILAVETEGAASYAASIEAGKLVELDKIETIATTLGARKVTQKALDWRDVFTILPWQTTDAAAIAACLQFADDYRTLVEPSCGAALSAVYVPADEIGDYDHIQIVVCGGAGVNVSLLNSWEGLSG